MDNLPNPPVLIKCPYCGHVWYTKVRRKYVTCPNCYKTFKKEGAILE